ncbi:MAG: hypothetical protein WBA09_11440, partial [Candidatus Acidiferrum sp.]
MIRTYNNLLRGVFLAGALLPAFALYIGLTPPVFRSDIVELFLYLFLGILLTLAFHRLLIRLQPALALRADEQIAFIDSLADRFLPLAIAGSAAISLALELSMIRWQGTIFPFFAFYKNYGLLACFAGLGLGYALARRSAGLPLVFTPALCAWQFALLLYLRFGLAKGMSGFGVVPFREQLSMGLAAASSNQVLGVNLLLGVVFLLTALAFIPVGQLCGRLMERQSQLSAYGWNLLGSLAGVALIFLTSFLWTPPVVWFSLCFLALIFLFPRNPAALFSGVAFVIAALIILAWPVAPLWNKVYSPYQLLEVGQGTDGLMMIRAAGNYYQRVHNLSKSALNGSSDRVLLEIRNYYDLPFRFHPGPNDVAIVGAGSGNDVAAALRSGAAHVDAIEIDPAIFALGEANHPEHPYDNAHVQPILDDARSFFRNTRGRYDIIVYGLLDSHTLLSYASNLRLDSF